MTLPARRLLPLPQPGREAGGHPHTFPSAPRGAPRALAVPRYPGGWDPIRSFLPLPARDRIRGVTGIIMMIFF